MNNNNFKLDVLKKLEHFSGAEIRAVCTESGYFAIRNKRTKIIESDLLLAVEKVKQKEKQDESYLKMFG